MTYIVGHTGDNGSIMMTPRGAYRAIRHAGHAAPTTARRIITDMVTGRVVIAWVGWVGYGVHGSRLTAQQID